MSSDLYLPPDQFGGSKPPNVELAADYLELRAVCAIDGKSFCQDIIDTLELSAEQDFPSVDAEIAQRETVAEEAANRILFRKKALGPLIRSHWIRAGTRSPLLLRSRIWEKPPMWYHSCYPTCILYRSYSTDLTDTLLMKKYAGSANISSTSQRQL